MARLLIVAYIAPAIPLFFIALFNNGAWPLLLLYPVFLCSLIFFGVPVLRQFFKRGLFKLHHSILAGAISAIPVFICGMLLLYMLPAKLQPPNQLYSSLHFLGYCLLSGSIVSALYWLLDIWRNKALAINPRGAR